MKKPNLNAVQKPKLYYKKPKLTYVTVKSDLREKSKERGGKGRYTSKLKSLSTFREMDGSGAATLKEKVKERGEKGRSKSTYKGVKIKKDGTAVVTKVRERGEKGRSTERKISKKAAKRKIKRIKKKEKKKMK